MFSNISWSAYFTGLALATAGYYLIIGYVFYRANIKALFFNKADPGNKPLLPATPATAAEIPATMPTAAMAEEKPPFVPDIDQLERIINEIRYEIIPKAGQKPTKDKLSVLFSNYLRDLPGNLPRAFKNSINQLLIKEAGQQCNIAFEEDEIRQLW